MSSNIVLTGGTGFVGNQVLKGLLAQKCNVRLLARSKESVSELDYGGNLEVVFVEDLFSSSQKKLEELIKPVDTLIHTAWYAEPGKYLNSEKNLSCLSGTLRLAQAFQAVGGRRFVGIGTCFEYDLSIGMLRADSPLNPQTLYAACKASTFQTLGQLLPDAGVEFAWCRLFYLYGEGEDSRRLVPHLRQRLSEGRAAELTSGRQIRDFLDVRDAASMIADVALGDQQGPINICSGIPITVRQLAEQIADEYGRRDLLHFGARPDNLFDPPCVVGVKGAVGDS